MITPVTDKLIKKFNKTNLSLEDRIALTNTILSTLSVLPINDVVEIIPATETTNVVIKINGRRLGTEDMIAFTESCKALKDNKARQVINDHIKFIALNFGINKSVRLEDLMFAKAAIFNIQQENELLDKIV